MRRQYTHTTGMRCHLYARHGYRGDCFSPGRHARQQIRRRFSAMRIVVYGITHPVVDFRARDLIPLAVFPSAEIEFRQLRIGFNGGQLHRLHHGFDR